MFRSVQRAAPSIILVAALFAGQAADATMMEIHKTAKSGQPSLIGHLWNCKDHVPPENTAAPEHGSVTLKDVQIDQCGNPKEPAREVWYTSAPGFKGVDTVRFMMGSQGAAGISYIVTVQ